MFQKEIPKYKINFGKINTIHFPLFDYMKSKGGFTPIGKLKDLKIKFVLSRTTDNERYMYYVLMTL